MHQVLLVDDEVYARKGLRKLIRWEACGFEVAGEANDGDEACTQIEQLQPDVVITDIRMPETDGLELIRRMVERDAQVLAKSKQPYFIIVSGYNDFAYAQQAVRYGVQDYILKPIDEVELEGTLCKLAKELNRHKLAEQTRRELEYVRLLDQFIYGESNLETVEQWTELTGTYADDPLVYLLFENNAPHMQVSDTAQEEKREAGNGENFGRVVQSVLGKMYPNRSYLHVKEHGERVGLLLTGGELRPFSMNLHAVAGKIQSCFAEMSHESVSIYIGAICYEPLLIGHAYQTALQAIAYKFISDKNGIVLYDDMQHEPVQWVHTNHEKEQELLTLMEEQRVQALENALGEWFTGMKTAHYAPVAVTSAIHQLISAILSILKSAEVNVKEISSFRPILAWQAERGTMAQARQLLTVFMLDSARKLAEQRQYYHRGAMTKIKNYIETNYSSNISLRSIASEFYMNPVYLGQRFRKVYGVYFNDFLLQLRIEKAKKLLRQTDLRIYEIAEKVGFGSSDYFTTQFEKTELCSPTEYRNRILDEG
ncbi:response regulator [Paenibacillus sp. FSL K6-0108]|uniref:response regulator n=1 Tax=Paenibacillus sp. FSL K6-0108 TaxID=2921417 RepID=UPI003244361A